MPLPLLQLALPRAVPLVFAARTTLGGCFAAVSTLRVVHELLEDVGRVELHDAIHVFFEGFVVLGEEMLSLVGCNGFPVAVLHLKPELGYLLHDEAVFGGN